MPEATDEAADVVATRLAYDAVAEDYAELLHAQLPTTPYDRAMLAVFAELVRAGYGGRAGGGRVADLGCGPGRITAHLNSLGLDAFGIDLSPGMIAVARHRHPDLAFEVGSMEALDLPDGGLSGLVAWYSIIHTPPERLPTVFAEFARVLMRGGVALLAFQMPSGSVSSVSLPSVSESSGGVPAVGAEPRHLAHAYGHDIDLDAYRLPPETIGAMLGDAGFSMEARLIREPGETERTEQAFLLGRLT